VEVSDIELAHVMTHLRFTSAFNFHSLAILSIYDRRMTYVIFKGSKT
jgi:hypothetical protein